MELEGTTLMNSHCEIQLDQVELDKFLKHVFQKNVIWDLGYQFGLLQRSVNKSSGDRNKFSTSCYFPCSNFMSAWRKHFDLEDILNRTEVHNCGRKGVFNTPGAF